MNTGDFDAYVNLLRNDGFSVSGGDQDQKWWKIGYVTPEREKFYIYFFLNTDSLFWEFPTLLSLSNKPECREGLARYLLLLNYQLRVVKFTLDENEQVCMIAEQVGTTISFAAFKSIFNIMRVYYEQYQLPLRMIANNPTAAQAWLALRPVEMEDVDIVTP